VRIHGGVSGSRPRVKDHSRMDAGLPKALGSEHGTCTRRVRRAELGQARSDRRPRHRAYRNESSARICLRSLLRKACFVSDRLTETRKRPAV
jgi:hypothetical protein